MRLERGTRLDVSVRHPGVGEGRHLIENVYRAAEQEQGQSRARALAKAQAEMEHGGHAQDLGGIMMGYEAFKKTDQYKKNIVIGGLYPDQRFFLGYALAWMVNQRPEAMAMQVKSNEHSPPKFRVIGPLSNMPEFYKTFNVNPGDAMWRPDSLRVKIW